VENLVAVSHIWYAIGVMKPVVFLDWHGTLSNSVFWNSFEEGSAKEQFLLKRMNDEIFCFWGQDPGHFLGAWVKGEITSEEFVTAIAEHLGEEYNWMWFRFVEDCKNFRLDSFSYLDQIKDIRKHATVVIATDQGEAFERFILPVVQLDDHLDDMLISSVTGSAKVTPREFYEKYLGVIESGEGMLIDNSLSSCERFTKLGGHAIHINSDTTMTQALSEALKWVKLV